MNNFQDITYARHEKTSEKSIHYIQQEYKQKQNTKYLNK